MEAPLDQISATNHGEASALLIDFAKACDTLDRRFLIGTLESLPTQICTNIRGFAPWYDSAVPAEWETGTPFRSFARISSGLSLSSVTLCYCDGLYRHIACGNGHCGAKLRLENKRRTLRMAGYVDDVKLVLRNISDFHRALGLSRRLAGFALSRGPSPS
ncbi:TPA: hypothetical protein N0F65_009437 [Lagenidium giganteum]|uniref:Reverse transcriptase domain-containing protein n=1 Tax=Lagenidium giganteum TaxID=4803 RepID=A0AAV2ZDJ9_9STRA|nr:TPA: hypothetical protein N0F65_009437 [Lagenidium giganteum]